LCLLRGRKNEHPIPHFAATNKPETRFKPEASKPAVALKPMIAGREVTEDHDHLALTLGQDPVTFLREDMAQQKVLSCRDAVDLAGARWVRTAGLILVRQMPNSATGVMLITLEGEIGGPDPVFWSKIFEWARYAILGHRMQRIDGRSKQAASVKLRGICISDLSLEALKLRMRDFR